MNIKEQLIQECVNIVKRKDIKEEINELVKPILEMLLSELYPYLYILIIFIVLCFLISLINLILLYRGKYLSHSNNG
jgi:uncharacterized membrane protein (DUF106 family)